MRPRCPTCYRPLGIGPHVCPPHVQKGEPAPRVRSMPTAEQREAANRRRSPLTRDEYLAQHRTTRDRKLALGRERQARYRARQSERRGEAS